MNIEIEHSLEGVTISESVIRDFPHAFPGPAPGTLGPTLQARAFCQSDKRPLALCTEYEYYSENGELLNQHRKEIRFDTKWRNTYFPISLPLFPPDGTATVKLVVSASRSAGGWLLLGKGATILLMLVILFFIWRGFAS